MVTGWRWTRDYYPTGLRLVRMLASVAGCPVLFGSWLSGRVRSARGLRAVDFDSRIERQQRLGEVPRVAGDALVANAEHRMRAIEAIKRRAAGPGNAFVAIGV